MQGYSVVIPAFNEADVIARVLGELGRPEGCREIFVIDDGSTDSTGKVARECGATVLTHRDNRGYGAAVATGIHAATTEYVIVFDGDGQHRAEDLIRLAQAADQYDMVIGVRGRESFSDWQRIAGRTLLGWVAEILTGRKIPDLNSGLRSFRTAVIRKYLHLMPRGFSFSTTSTIAMCRMGHAVGYVPIVVGRRQGRKSNLKILDDGIKTLMLIINLTVLFNPMRVFLPLAFFLMGSALVYFLLYCVFVRIHVTASMTLLFTAGVVLFFMGVICEQVSAIRRELYK